MRYVTKSVMMALLIVLFTASLYAQTNFATSIHATRAGKNFWYGADTSVTKAPAPGFETLTHVPINDPNVACNSCHPADNLDANGDAYAIPYPGASCVDCHATKSGMRVTEDDCYGCHGRQAAEAKTLNLSDVHRNASNPLKCWNCHKKAELHGDDGVTYNSMFEPGAIKSDCSDCHTTQAGTLPDHSSYDPHKGKLHCDACHTQTAIACYNCHFESQVDAAKKRAKQTIQGFIILVNRAKDGKVGTASFQSLTYKGKAWVAFGPFHSHSVTKNGRKCVDCHQNFGGQIAAIQEYNTTGKIQFAKWNASDSTLSWVKGVIPFPENYQTAFKMDFLTYNGSSSDPVAPSNNWSTIGKDTWDGHQLFFATPLSRAQMSKLGMNPPTGIDDAASSDLPATYALYQNYPNPFNPTTTISFDLSEAQFVQLKLFNLAGQEIKTVLNQPMPSGHHSVILFAHDLPSGVYVYQIIAGQYMASKKLVLMK